MYAQDSTAEKAVPAPTRWEVFFGYTFFVPRDTVTVAQPDGSLATLSYHVEKYGFSASYAWFLGRHFGLQIESSQHDLLADTGSSLTTTSNSGIFTLEPGVIYRMEKGRYNSYFHALAGVAETDGPSHEPYVWGPGATVGGGLDVNTKLLRHHLSVRLFQIDYEYVHANSLSKPGLTLAAGPVWRDDENVNAFKLSSGLVLRGGIVPEPDRMSLACVAEPAMVNPGEPVTVIGTAEHVKAKKTPVYTWHSTGGSATGSGASTTIDTTGLTPGTYTVAGTVAEGRKSYEIGHCSQSFAVKAPAPPTLTCSVSPATMVAGDVATISAKASDAKSGQLVYSYTATAGKLKEDGATATLDTQGVADGVIGITCTVTDQYGQKTTAATSEAVEMAGPVPAPVPPKPESSMLCPISFDRYPKLPTRVNNEAKACLDDMTLVLQRSSDATLDLVGNAKRDEPHSEQTAAQRAINTKDYLVKEKGIDAARIAVFTGSAEEKSVTATLVPAGATPVAATPIDETVVKAIAREPLGTKKPAKKHPAPAAKTTP